MNYKPLLASLEKMLEARLAFRKAPLTESLQMVMGNAIKSGNSGSGRLGIIVAGVYEQEAQSRAELITNELRQARSSWSPKQLVNAGPELRAAVSDLFKKNLAEAASLAEQIGGIQAKRHNQQYAGVVTSFLNYSNDASRAAMSIVDAGINEILAAAANDLAAQGPAERPSYVFQNNFHGPVASVAQGTASVTAVSQHVGTATPEELADAVKRLIHALPPDQLDAPRFTEPKKALEAAEKELREGKVPFGAINRALNLLQKIEDVAIRAPDALQHLKSLGSMLGL